MTRTTKRFITSGGFLVITGILMLVFKHFPEKCFPWYRNLSRTLMKWISAATSFVPVAIWDFAEIALIILLVISVIVMIVKRRRFVCWLSKVFLTVSIMAFTVVAVWMLNHYAPPLAEEINLSKRMYSQSELYDAAKYYTTQASEYAKLAERDTYGNLKKQDFYELAEIAGKSYSVLKDKYTIFNGSERPVKKLWLLGDYLLYKGFTGEFMPYTAEASVPENDSNVDLPFVMCHETAHRLGIASEEEANFAAYLSCESNEDVRFRYSGYYMAFVYCYNALSPELRNKLSAEMENNEGYFLLRTDCNASSEHYDKYDGRLSDVGEEVNDKYLKSFSQESGVKSYGEVVDDLVAWYQKNI